MGGGDVRLGESRWLVTGEHPRVRSWTSPMRRGARTKTYPPADRENTPSSTTRWKWKCALRRNRLRRSSASPQVSLIT